MSRTRPTTLRRRQIPALVGHWNTEDIPGYLEIDLVSHSGEFAAGTFLYTLSTEERTVATRSGSWSAALLSSRHRLQPSQRPH